MPYKVVNGTSYDSRTPDRLIAELETAMRHNKKVRIFLGDTETILLAVGVAVNGQPPPGYRGLT